MTVFVIPLVGPKATVPGTTSWNFGFVRNPGKFNGFLPCFLGLFWILGLCTLLQQQGVQSLDHANNTPEVKTLIERFIIRVLAGASLSAFGMFPLVVIGWYGKQVDQLGPLFCHGICVAGSLNFIGWCFTSILGAFSLPLLGWGLASFMFHMMLYSLPLLFSFLWFTYVVHRLPPPHLYI